ncbi:hypothetical protein BCT31_03640 [Vibrio lentus]|nr:hypothetical protein BCT31_03640 [Vibrio lentus]
MPTPYSDNLYLRVYPILEKLIIAIEEDTQLVPAELIENFHIEVNPHVLPWITPELYRQLAEQILKSTLGRLR